MPKPTIELPDVPGGWLNNPAATPPYAPDYIARADPGQAGVFGGVFVEPQDPAQMHGCYRKRPWGKGPCVTETGERQRAVEAA